VRKALRDNALSLIMLGLFVLFWGGQSVTGWHHHNAELTEHDRPAVTWWQYVRSGDFFEATAENWESEFLQMGLFVLLSAFLVQRGSAESKKPEGDEHEEDPERARKPDSPWPVQRGGLLLKLYSNSLSVVLLTLFAGSFAIHVAAGVAAHNEEAAAHGGATLTAWQFLGSSELWFQSFQNWQSEFLSVGVLVVLSIFLRQQGSPQSKPVHAAHAETGSS
jgi:hypothetical protein